MKAQMAIDVARTVEEEAERTQREEQAAKEEDEAARKEKEAARKEKEAAEDAERKEKEETKLAADEAEKDDEREKDRTAEEEIAEIIAREQEKAREAKMTKKKKEEKEKKTGDTAKEEEERQARLAEEERARKEEKDTEVAIIVLEIDAIRKKDEDEAAMKAGEDAKIVADDEEAGRKEAKDAKVVPEFEELHTTQIVPEEEETTVEITEPVAVELFLEPLKQTGTKKEKISENETYVLQVTEEVMSSSEREIIDNENKLIEQEIEFNEVPVLGNDEILSSNQANAPTEDIIEHVETTNYFIESTMANGAENIIDEILVKNYREIKIVEELENQSDRANKNITDIPAIADGFAPVSCHLNSIQEITALETDLEPETETENVKLTPSWPDQDRTQERLRPQEEGKTALLLCCLLVLFLGLMFGGLSNQDGEVRLEFLINCYFLNPTIAG